MDVDVPPPSVTLSMQTDAVIRVPAPFRQLPLELWDYILDHLWSDRRSLKACSLTCKAWRPTTCYHLFRQLVVSYEKLHKFDELATSSLCPYFREVFIYQPTGMAAYFILKATPLLEQLTRIKCVKFYCMHQAVGWPSLDFPLRMTPSVKELRISYSFFEDYNGLASLISSFPNLSAIYLEYGGLGSSSTRTCFPFRPLEYEFPTREASISIQEMTCISIDIDIIAALLAAMKRDPQFTSCPRTLRLAMDQPLEENGITQTKLDDIFQWEEASLEHLWLTLQHKLQSEFIFDIRFQPADIMKHFSTSSKVCINDEHLVLYQSRIPPFEYQVC